MPAAEKRVVQVPLDDVEGSQLTTFAAIGSAIVNAHQYAARGDGIQVVRAMASANECIQNALACFATGQYTWETWRALNRRMATLAAVAFPETPVEWHGDRRPGEGPRPGEKGA